MLKCFYFFEVLGRPEKNPGKIWKNVFYITFESFFFAGGGGLRFGSPSRPLSAKTCFFSESFNPSKIADYTS